MKKKNGYTLAEVLITLGIIGVIAAVCAPLINKYKPDTTKIMYLKTYDMVVDTVQKLIANETIYPTVDNANNDCKDYPLYNTDAVEIDADTIINPNGNKDKLTYALAYAMGVDINKDPDTFSYSGDTLDYGVILKNPHFITNNGTPFFVSTFKDTSQKEYVSNVYFDIDGVDKGSNCLYRSAYPNQCKTPDVFYLKILADGSVYPADKMGAAYLANRSNWRKSDIDLDEVNLEDPDTKVEISEAVTATDNFTAKAVDVEPDIDNPTQTTPLISSFYWGDTPLVFVDDNWYNPFEPCYKRVIEEITSFLKNAMKYMEDEGYPPEKIQKAYEAVLSYYANLLYSQIQGAGKKSDQYYNASVSYKNAKGQNVTATGQRYYSTCWYTKGTTQAHLKAAAAKRDVYTGIYLGKKYEDTDRIQMVVDMNRVKDLFVNFYKTIE